jgi:hypothetical protein
MGLSFVGLFFGTGALLLGLTSGYPCPSDPVGQISVGCPTAQSLALHILLPSGIVILSITGFVAAFRKPKTTQSETTRAAT